MRRFRKTCQKMGASLRWTKVQIVKLTILLSYSLSANAVSDIYSVIESSNLSYTPFAETIPEDVFCNEEEVPSDIYGNFSFPKILATKEGNEIRLECPLGLRDDGYESIYHNVATTAATKELKAEISGVRRKCQLYKSENGSAYGKWEPSSINLNISYCREKLGVSAEQWLKDGLKTITPLTIRQIVPRLTRLLLHVANDLTCANAYINGISNLLTSPQFDGVTDRGFLFSCVQDCIKKVTEYITPGLTRKMGNEGIILETVKFHSSKYYARFVKDVSWVSREINLKPYKTNLLAENSTNVDIVISEEALQSSVEQASMEPNLTILWYSDEIIKMWSNIAPTTTKAPTSTPATYKADREPYTTWGLLLIELDGLILNLADQIEFLIPNQTIPHGYYIKCVYWDGDAGVWATDGVTTLQMTDGVKCTSTHLTAFSALIEPLPLPFPDSEYAPVNNSVHGYILSILSSTGSVFSIIGLSLTLLTFALFRSLRRERSNRILLNLCSSLLLMHIMSISGSKSLWDGHCFVPAASLHYLVLTSLAWMMVEAVHMFELLISVFVRPENRFLLKRFILAWGIPLVIVIICTIVRPNVYKVGRADLCLMSAHQNIVLYYVAYIAPICIMLLVNVTIFCKIFRVLYQQTKRTKGKTSNAKGAVPKYQFVKISPSQIKGATTVLVLLGIGWILGLLAIGPFEVFFRYMYCICNAGQGAFIFIFRVALNPHATKQWKRVILGFSLDNSLDVSVTTSSSAGSSGNPPKKRTSMLSTNFISASNSVENSLTPSNPLSASLATTLASMLRSEDERAATNIAHLNKTN